MGSDAEFPFSGHTSKPGLKSVNISTVSTLSLYQTIKRRRRFYTEIQNHFKSIKGRPDKKLSKTRDDIWRAKVISTDKSFQFGVV